MREGEYEENKNKTELKIRDVGNEDAFPRPFPSHILPSSAIAVRTLEGYTH